MAFETIKGLVGAETAQRLRLLKAELARDPLDLSPPTDQISTPTDADIYDERPPITEMDYRDY